MSDEKTVTGRFSIQEPEVQDLPGSYCERYRNAREKGEEFIVTDYAEFEKRTLLRLLSTEELMHEIIRRGK